MTVERGDGDMATRAFPYVCDLDLASSCVTVASGGAANDRRLRGCSVQPDVLLVKIRLHATQFIDHVQVHIYRYKGAQPRLVSQTIHCT